MNYPILCKNLIIGSGPGSAVAAYELSKAGHEVIVLEEGDKYDKVFYKNSIQGLTSELYRNGGIFPFFGKPSVAFAEARCLGGGSVINGGLIWRTPKFVLDEWVEKKILPKSFIKSLVRHFPFVESMLEVGYSKEINGNEDSNIIKKTSIKLKWKCVDVPRAGGGLCKNSNRCATGCPKAAKKSVDLNYLYLAKKFGAQIFTSHKVVKLLHDKKTILEVHVLDIKSNKIVKFKPENVWFGAGAIHTPFLLKKHGISKNAGKKLEFHLNLKFIAEFDKSINAEDGTIFTQQIQHFIKKGILFMPTNYRPEYLATSLSHFDNLTIKHVFKNYDKHGMFVSQIRPSSQAKIYSFTDSPIVTYKLKTQDFLLIKDSFRLMAKLLFKSGAKKIYCPVSNFNPVRNEEDLDILLKKMKPNDLQMISVHIMSSCQMGSAKDSVVDLNGKLRNFKNIYIVDASVLPTNIGESPQGTIMAFSHETLKRFIFKW